MADASATTTRLRFLAFLSLNFPTGTCTGITSWIIMTTCLGLVSFCYFPTRHCMIKPDRPLWILKFIWYCMNKFITQNPPGFQWYVEYRNRLTSDTSRRSVPRVGILYLGHLWLRHCGMFHSLAHYRTRRPKSDRDQHLFTRVHLCCQVTGLLELRQIFEISLCDGENECHNFFDIILYLVRYYQSLLCPSVKRAGHSAPGKI